MLIRAICKRAFLASALMVPSAWWAAGADTLSVGSTNPGEGLTGVVLPMEVANESGVVGVQFTLRYPEGYVEPGEPLILSGSSDHRVVSSDDTLGTRGVVVMSRTNAVLPDDFSLGLPMVLGEGSPSGGPSVSIGGVVFTDAAGNAIPSATEYTLVETWRQANFSQAEREEGSLIGDDFDADGDGTTNLEELGGGTDPRIGDARDAGSVDFELGGDGKVYVTMKFWRSSDPAVRAAVPRIGETSVDLEVWSEEEVTVEATGVSDASGEEVEVTAEVKAGDVRRFLRVRTGRAAGE